MIITPVMSSVIVTGSAPFVFDASATALFAAFSTPPTEERKLTINTLIVALKAAGIWDITDRLSVMAAADTQAALIDWKSGTTFLTPRNAPTFAADRGYTGNGSNSDINCGFNPGAGGLNFTANSNSTSFWMRNATIESTKYLLGSDNARLIWTRTGATAVEYRAVDTASSIGVTSGNSSGLMVANRTGASARQSYQNGSQTSSDTTAVGGLPGAVYLLSAGASNYSANEVSYYRTGAALSAAQALAEFNAVYAYLQAIGAA